MQGPTASVSAGRRFLFVLVALAIAATACAYEVPLTPAVSVARSTFIYDESGALLTSLHAEEDREPVELDEVADVFVDAVIAIEDERFFHHNGIDVRATTRALLRNLEVGEVAQGGSTLTQQYVGNVLIGQELEPGQRTLGREDSLERKIKEASLAYQLERRMTKEAILERYLNTVYFGNGAYGAEAAAKRFFGKTARDVTLSEAALLAGMIRAPERYDPYESPDVAERRREGVLRKMRSLRMISDAELESATATEPELILVDDRYPAGHYVESVKRFILDNEEFGETRQERRDLLFKGGLRIHTNINMNMQRAAEQAVQEGIAGEETIISALVAVEPSTGRVRAVWGGYDFFGEEPKAKFNFATQGGRQAGSAFKIFALIAALNEGVGPTETYPAPSRTRLSFGDPPQEWNVQNYGGGGYGSLSLEAATVRSVNTVFAQLILDVGPEKAVALAKEMGIASDLNPNPAAVLGTNDVTPLDMAMAYGTLAGDGMRAEPQFIDRITDAEGNTIWESTTARRRVLSKNVARTTTAILEQVVCCGTGTAARLDDGRDQAGKTGTSQEWRDAMYIGYTPDLVTAVWVGHPDGQISMTPPVSNRRVTGGSYPAEIWKLFMQQALADIPPGEFPPAAPFEATKKIEVRVRVPCSPSDLTTDPDAPDGDAPGDEPSGDEEALFDLSGARPIADEHDPEEPPSTDESTTTTESSTTTTAPPASTTTTAAEPTTTTAKKKQKKSTTTVEETTTTRAAPTTTAPCYETVEGDDRIVDIDEDETGTTDYNDGF